MPKGWGLTPAGSSAHTAAGPIPLHLQPQWDMGRAKEEHKKTVGGDRNCSVSKGEREEEGKKIKQTN